MMSDKWWSGLGVSSKPRCSMYGIFTYFWAIFGVNVGKYSIHGASGKDNALWQSFERSEYPGSDHTGRLSLDVPNGTYFKCEGAFSCTVLYRYTLFTWLFRATCFLDVWKLSGPLNIVKTARSLGVLNAHWRQDENPSCPDDVWKSVILVSQNRLLFGVLVSSAKKKRPSWAVVVLGSLGNSLHPSIISLLVVLLILCIWMSLVEGK